jgi:hypothetical protein
MQFIYIEFDDNWSRESDNYKNALNHASLIVVTEGPTGVKTTYWFKVPKGEHVWIGGDQGNENIIYIPTTCIDAKYGDHSKCAKILPRKKK